MAPPSPPETADPTTWAMRLHHRVDSSSGFQRVLTRTGLGDWILAGAGLPGLVL